MPVLYLVGTPIGNLEDITLRALRVLKDVALVAAEDTRKARVLFNRYEIKTPLTSYHEQGQRYKAPSLIKQLAGKDVALITEAGMPSVSDPGYALVRAASGGWLSGEGGARALGGHRRPGRLRSAHRPVPVPGLPPTDRRTAKGPALVRSAGAPDSRGAGGAPPPQSLSGGDCVALRRPAHSRVPRDDEAARKRSSRLRPSSGGALSATQGRVHPGHRRRRAHEEPTSNADVTSRLKRLRRTGVRAKEAVAQVTLETGGPGKRFTACGLTWAIRRASSPRRSPKGRPPQRGRFHLGRLLRGALLTLTHSSLKNSGSRNCRSSATWARSMDRLLGKAATSTYLPTF